MLPHDLKNYEAPRFNLFTSEEAGYLLLALFALALILERLGVI